MKKSFVTVLLFVFAVSSLFCIGIKDMSDWEQEIKKLDCVEFIKIEKDVPNDKEDNYNHIKLYLTEKRFIQIKYFNPYIENLYPGQFYVERIGNIVPVLWGYRCNRVSINDNDGYSYHLGFDRFRFDYLCYFIKKNQV